MAEYYVSRAALKVVKFTAITCLQCWPIAINIGTYICESLKCDKLTHAYVFF